jgi:hypothetical protein
MPPGTFIDFSAQVLMIEEPGILVYLGRGYFPRGGVNLSPLSAIEMPPVPPGDEPRSVVTFPFTLSGSILGQTFSPSDPDISFEVLGGGMATAFLESHAGTTEWRLRFISYELAPLDQGTVPEPATWALVGSGLLGFAARRRSTHPNR